MEQALQFLIGYEYPLLFLWVFVDQIGVPLSSTPMLLAAGVLAGEGKLQLHMAMEIAVAASVLSNLIWYQIGKRRGNSVLALLCGISLTPESCIRRTAELFSRYGARSLLVAKFIPGLSLMAPPMSGAFRMSLLSFLLYNGTGSLLWVVTFSTLGYLFHAQIEHLFYYALRLSSYFVVLITGGLAAYLALRAMQRRRFLRSLQMARITPEELKDKLNRGGAPLVLDVRPLIEFKVEPSTIPGALHFPLEQLEKRSKEIPPDREIILLCD